MVLANTQLSQFMLMWSNDRFSLMQVLYFRAWCLASPLGSAVYSFYCSIVHWTPRFAVLEICSLNQNTGTGAVCASKENLLHGKAMLLFAVMLCCLASSCQNDWQLGLPKHSSDPTWLPFNMLSVPQDLEDFQVYSFLVANNSPKVKKLSVDTLPNRG